MATIEIHYSKLESVARSARSLSEQSADYADSLSRKVAGGISGVSGGGNANLNQASYYVNKKLQSLREKSASYGQYSVDVAQFADTAKRVDQQVRSEIAMNQENFLQHNEHLRISPWKQAFLNYVADWRNKSALFRAIVDGIDAMSHAVGGLKDKIRHWLVCEGGWEKIKRIGAVVIAVAAFIGAIATFIAASGVWATIAAVAGLIGAAIGLINAWTNYCDDELADSRHNGDPAWAKIYGKHDKKFSDLLRDQDWGAFNGVRDFIADGIDTVKVVCDIIGLVDGIYKIGKSINCVKNYFSSKGGLAQFMKTPVWEEHVVLDEYGRWSVQPFMKVDDAGNVVTHYTMKSIVKGLTAYLTNSPVGPDGQGLRTYLNGNFVMDFKDMVHSFSLRGISETAEYQLTESKGWTIITKTGSDNPNDIAKVTNAWKAFRNDFQIKDVTDFAKSTMKGVQDVSKIIIGGDTLTDMIRERTADRIIDLTIITQTEDKFNDIREKFDEIKLVWDKDYKKPEQESWRDRIEKQLETLQFYEKRQHNSIYRGQDVKNLSRF